MANELACWLRIARRNPAFLVVAILTLALGIGATTALFSVVDSVLLRPLPFPDPERLALVWDEPSSSEQAMFSVPDYLELRTRLRSFEQFAAHWGTDLETQGACALVSISEPEAVPCAAVRYNFFAALGVKPLLGRDFEEADERQSLARVAIISHALWQRRFGGDRRVIGQRIKVDGVAVSIIGVLPVTFEVPAHCQVWEPAGFDPEWRSEQRRGMRYLRAFARLKRGVSFQPAQMELHAAAEQLPLQRLNRITKRIGRLIPLQDVLVRDSRLGMLAMLAAAIGLLLIACSNVANLSLVMAAARSKELAVRAVAGADAGRLFRQSLMESLVLSLAGGILGAVLAGWGLKVLVALTPVWVPRLAEAGLNGRVFAFTLLVSFVAAVVFGLAPAIVGSRSSLPDRLAEGGRSDGGGHHRVSGVFVVAEVALAVLLVSGAALVFRSFENLRRVHPGFKAHDALTAKFLPDVSSQGPATDRYLKGVLERVRRIPGVQEAAISVDLPLTGWRQEFRFTLSAGLTDDPAALHSATLHGVSRGYFRAMGIPLLRGRDFLEEEERAAPAPRAIVNEELVRRFFAGQDPVGRSIHGQRRKFRMEIVGVAGNVRHRSLWDPPHPEVYMAGLGPYNLIVRAETDPRVLTAQIRAAVAEVDRNQPVAEFKTLEDIVEAAASRHRFWAFLLSSFAGASLCLAAAGVYGLVSYSVKRRLPEFAVRAAVGARPADILRLVLGRALKLAAIGALAGVLAALALARLLASLLFEVSPSDAPTLAVTVLGVISVALVAAYPPARAALRVDLAATLRSN